LKQSEKGNPCVVYKHVNGVAVGGYFVTQGVYLVYIAYVCFVESTARFFFKSFCRLVVASVIGKNGIARLGKGGSASGADPAGGARYQYGLPILTSISTGMTMGFFLVLEYSFEETASLTLPLMLFISRLP